MKAETLRRYGWRKIVSEVQAWQLLRHELKHHANWQQRDLYRRWDFRPLLDIKVGTWFKYLGNPKNGHCSLLLWTHVEEDE